MSITFVDEFGGHCDCTGNKYDLGTNNKFSKYKIESGKWILYQDAYYNKTNGDSSGVIYDFTGHNDSYKPLNFSPLSIKKTDDTPNSCIVFEHNNYCGQSKHYIISCPDVTIDFEPGRPSGASSIIIWPEKTWTLHKGKGYNGGSLTWDVP